MSRTVDAARIREARRAALRNRLIGEGLLPVQADHWIVTAEQHFGPPTDAAWYETAHVWIVARAPVAGRLAVTTEPPRGAGAA